MKMKVETRKVLYHTLDCYELAKAVNEFYKPTSEWDFISDHEANNDSDYSFDVDGKIDDYDKERLERFKKDSNSEGWMTQIFLDDLCKQELIPKGAYLIKVCW